MVQDHATMVPETEGSLAPVLSLARLEVVSLYPAAYTLTWCKLFFFFYFLCCGAMCLHCAFLCTCLLYKLPGVLLFFFCLSPEHRRVQESVKKRVS